MWEDNLQNNKILFFVSAIQVKKSLHFKEPLKYLILKSHSTVYNFENWFNEKSLV